MDDSSGLPDDPEQLQAAIEESEKKAALQVSITREDAKMERYEVSCLWNATAMLTNTQM